MKKWVGKALKWLGPAAGGFLAAGPAGAGAAVAGQVSAALAKKDGKKRQAKAGILASSLERSGHHQLTSPAAAVSTPVLLSLLLSRLGVEMPPEIVAAALGLVTWGSHYIGKRIEG